MSDSLLPISDEQAKAIQEGAKLGGKALDLIGDLGGFLKEILGEPVKDLVGVLGADWLRVRRAENLAKALEQAKERLRARQVKETEPPSLTIALPLLQAAAEESEPELVDLWARLIAAAMDPQRKGHVRKSFIDLVKQMAPVDAYVLREMGKEQNWSPSKREAFAINYKVGGDTIAASFEHLGRLGLISVPSSSDNPVTTPTGRELLRAVSD